MASMEEIRSARAELDVVNRQHGFRRSYPPRTTRPKEKAEGRLLGRLQRIPVPLGSSALILNTSWLGFPEELLSPFQTLHLQRAWTSSLVSLNCTLHGLSERLQTLTGVQSSWISLRTRPRRRQRHEPGKD
jgi:hypothetical protein